MILEETVVFGGRSRDDLPVWGSVLLLTRHLLLEAFSDYTWLHISPDARVPIFLPGRSGSPAAPSPSHKPSSSSVASHQTPCQPSSPTVCYQLVLAPSQGSRYSWPPAGAASCFPASPCLCPPAHPTQSSLPRPLACWVHTPLAQRWLSGWTWLDSAAPSPCRMKLSPQSWSACSSNSPRRSCPCSSSGSCASTIPRNGCGFSFTTM